MRNRAELEIANRDSFILGPYGGKYGRERWKRDHPEQWKQITERYGQGITKKMKKNIYWSDTKWTTRPGIGLLNGGACCVDHPVKRKFKERLAMMKKNDTKNS